ncbi:hypothetical protein ACFV2Q_27680 [Streptomyces sp. NPDC059650]|uniref:hypothetical protein n=1 Tax=Streptomyces sp. NPDC059650 TaxID=3346896 RepID=UPI0036A9479F
MTTTARGRIPRLICASCISALLISAGATTAIAATQSPTPVQQIPRDDSGGSSETSDQSGNGTDTGNHPNAPTDNGGTDTGNHPNAPTDNGGTDTGNHPNAPTDNGGGQPPGDTVKNPGNSAGGITDQRRACENAGRPWVDTSSGGYCGEFGKISVPNNPNANKENKQAEHALDTINCVKDAAALLSPAKRIAQAYGQVASIAVKGSKIEAIVTDTSLASASGNNEYKKRLVLDIIGVRGCYTLGQKTISGAYK